MGEAQTLKAIVQLKISVVNVLEKKKMKRQNKSEGLDVAHWPPLALALPAVGRRHGGGRRWSNSRVFIKADVFVDSLLMGPDGLSRSKSGIGLCKVA